MRTAPTPGRAFPTCARRCSPILTRDHGERPGSRRCRCTGHARRPVVGHPAVRSAIALLTESWKRGRLPRRTTLLEFFTPAAALPECFRFFAIARIAILISGLGVDYSTRAPLVIAFPSLRDSKARRSQVSPAVPPPCRLGVRRAKPSRMVPGYRRVRGRQRRW